MAHLIVDPAVPPREVWIEGRDVHVEMVDGMIHLIPTGEHVIRVRLAYVAGVDGPPRVEDPETVC